MDGHELSSGLNGEKAAVNMCNYPELVFSGNETNNDQPKLALEVELSLNNLIRLGLLYNETAGATPIWIRLSALGKEFYQACQK